ncbi:MAG TPA: hypothetical protein PLK80_17165, partial [bacterium]|nr:hypothetical protein [bacterium]
HRVCELKPFKDKRRTCKNKVAAYRPLWKEEAFKKLWEIESIPGNEIFVDRRSMIFTVVEYGCCGGDNANHVYSNDGNHLFSYTTTIGNFEHPENISLKGDNLAFCAIGEDHVYLLVSDEKSGVDYFKTEIPAELRAKVKINYTCSFEDDGNLTLHANSKNAVSI